MLVVIVLVEDASQTLFFAADIKTVNPKAIGNGKIESRQAS